MPTVLTAVSKPFFISLLIAFLSACVDTGGSNNGSTDADNDGVTNSADSCPASPSSEAADADGCTPSQLDDDNDNVHNGLDLCPNSPTNQQVNGNGCAQSQLDSDQDGVSNRDDACPNTASDDRDNVNARGCSNDESDDDLDLVVNSQDQCPDTREDQRSNVDNQGCAPYQLDDDNDGRANDIDQCPNTDEGETVDAQGCAQNQLDDDQDGVTNNLDQCPNTPNTDSSINAVGCGESERDSDNDGVNDKLDQCAATPAGEPLVRDGCSASQLDDDNDNVTNDQDACPTTPSDKRPVNAQGCADAELDSDNDGVDDETDQCPGTAPSGGTIAPNGCYVADNDDDQDSISNGDDDCDNTPASERDQINAQGCGPSERDTDGDGKNDNVDDCDNTPNSEITQIDAQGCGPSEVDSDGDGFRDNVDACVNTPAAEINDVNFEGCGPSERDTDADTVSDANDLCPATPNTDLDVHTDPATQAETLGCGESQRDTDEDGVADKSDQCPNTLPRSANDTNQLHVDPAGCSVEFCHRGASVGLSVCLGDSVAPFINCAVASSSNEERIACAEHSNFADQFARMNDIVDNTCPTEAVIREAGFGDLINQQNLKRKLENACIGQIESLFARTYGGPHGKLLDTLSNPVDINCLNTAASEAAKIIIGSYDEYTQCVHDGSCTDPEAGRATRDSEALNAITAACPTMEETMGSSPQVYIDRANEQSRCMVAEGHGQTDNIDLDCGPNSILLDAVTIRTENISGEIINGIDNIPPMDELYIQMDNDAWGTSCSNGTPYAFIMRLSDDDDFIDNLLFHQEGGGVCLSGTGDCANPSNGTKNFDASNRSGADIRKGYHAVRQENRFANWTHVFQTYCTQDLHIGGGGTEATPREDHIDNNGLMSRNGAINVRASTKFMRDLIWRLRQHSTDTGYLPTQPEVIYSGTSAGGYGVQYNLHYPMDEMRWDNTMGNSHAAFVIGGGTTPIENLYTTVGNTWATRPMQTPYCLEDVCSTSIVNHPAHAERMGETPFNLMLNTTAQHDHTQESTQGYPGPVAPPTPIEGKEAKDWLNILRDSYCELKDTANLYFHWGANTARKHDYLNTNDFYNINNLSAQQLMVNGEDMAHWLAEVAHHPSGVIDRVENGITIDGVAHFECPLTPSLAAGDEDNDGVPNLTDICRGNDGVPVANNGCEITASDADQDGIPDDSDQCAETPLGAIANQHGCHNTDGDDVANELDNCDAYGNNNQADTDNDGLGDSCDEDIDNDSVHNADDNCPFVANTDQADTNPLTTTGDACDAPASARPRATPDCYQADLLVAPDANLHECTWNHLAHKLQRQLDINTPMVESLWLASHNSYNSPDATNQSSSDFNQITGIADQLTLEMRGLELDVHWFESPRCSGDLKPLVCHSQPNHSTCSGSEPTVDQHFATIKGWLDDNPDEIIQIDLTDTFPGFERFVPCGPAPEPTQEQQDAAIATIHQMLIDAFGGLIYTPSDSGNPAIPLDVTRQEIFDLGKRVLITGGNDPDWSNTVHNLGPRQQKRHNGHDNRCDIGDTWDGGATISETHYRSSWTRMWEDLTAVGVGFNQGQNPINDSVLIEMMECGLNMPSLDRLTANDTRLIAGVWSWAESEPTINDEANCALHNSDNRFISADCGVEKNYACSNDAQTEWKITSATGTWEDGAAACATEGLLYATPATAYFNTLLNAVKTADGISEVWLNYREDFINEGSWVNTP